ncbi:MAG: YveK family protein [Lachnospiraceae bacterium]
MGTQMNDDEVEIDLLELLMVLLSQWKKILLSTVLVGGTALLISLFIMTPQYESTSALYVLSKSTSITSLADIQMGSNLTNDYMVVVKCRPVLEQVIENLDLEEDYKQLDEKVEVNNPTDTRILQITVTDEDPVRAKKITDELATVSAAYIAEKMDQDPPTLIQKGYADGKPSSPNIPKNVVIGVLVGFVLAGAVIIVSYLMDDTIMAGEDLENKLGLNVLGVLPEEEAEYDGKSSQKTKKQQKSAKN